MFHKVSITRGKSRKVRQKKNPTQPPPATQGNQSVFPDVTKQKDASECLEDGLFCSVHIRAHTRGDHLPLQTRCAVRCVAARCQLVARHGCVTRSPEAAPPQHSALLPSPSWKWSRLGGLRARPSFGTADLASGRALLGGTEPRLQLWGPQSSLVQLIVWIWSV